MFAVNPSAQSVVVKKSSIVADQMMYANNDRLRPQSKGSLRYQNESGEVNKAEFVQSRMSGSGNPSKAMVNY